MEEGKVEVVEQDNRFSIPVENLPLLREKLTKLNRTAMKLGCEPIAFTVLAHRIERSKATNEGGLDEEIVRELADIEVTGAAPKLAGWEFIGRIEVIHQDKLPPMTMVYSAPGKNVPQQYRDQPHQCDHCKTKRMRRNTYVVAKDTGESARVGSNCLKDFLGHKDPKMIAQFLTWIHEFTRNLRGEFSQGGWSDPMYKLDQLIPQLTAIIRVKSWVTKSMVQRAHDEGRPIPEATATVLAQIINPMRVIHSQAEARRIRQLAEDCKVIDADQNSKTGVLEMMSRAGDGTDFWYNLNQLAKLQAAPVKSWGLLAAIVGMWFKEQGKLAERKALCNEHLAMDVGARAEFSLTLHKLLTLEGQFGTTFMHQFRDHQNRVVIWFGSCGRLCNEGESVKVKATIKGFEDYKGIKQTLITRVKRIEVKAA